MLGLSLLVLGIPLNPLTVRRVNAPSRLLPQCSSRYRFRSDTRRLRLTTSPGANLWDAGCERLEGTSDDGHVVRRRPGGSVTVLLDALQKAPAGLSERGEQVLQRMSVSHRTTTHSVN